MTRFWLDEDPTGFNFGLYRVKGFHYLRGDNYLVQSCNGWGGVGGRGASVLSNCSFNKQKGLLQFHRSKKSNWTSQKPNEKRIYSGVVLKIAQHTAEPSWPSSPYRQRDTAPQYCSEKSCKCLHFRGHCNNLKCVLTPPSSSPCPSHLTVSGEVKRNKTNSRLCIIQTTLSVQMAEWRGRGGGQRGLGHAWALSQWHRWRIQN